MWVVAQKEKGNGGIKSSHRCLVRLPDWIMVLVMKRKEGGGDQRAGHWRYSKTHVVKAKAQFNIKPEPHRSLRI